MYFIVIAVVFVTRKGAMAIPQSKFVNVATTICYIMSFVMQIKIKRRCPEN